MNQAFGIVENTDGKLSGEEREKLVLENLREKHREQKISHREHQRKYLFSKARFLKDAEQPMKIAECDITALANKVKSKSQVCCQLLCTVMNALHDSSDNVTAFLKVDGALQALLRLLSGQNEKFQLISAQCICNLALGSEKESFNVLKAAESYLMVHLSGRNLFVKEVCAIALGNLSMQGSKNIEHLMRQGFLPKIIGLLKDGDPSLEAAALYALSQLIYNGFDILRPEELELCLLEVLPVFSKQSFSVAFLMSLLSSCKTIHHHFISNAVHFEALNYLLISLKENDKEAVYFLRILSNLSEEESATQELIEHRNYTLRECINCLLKSEKEYLKRECLALVGNFINNPRNVVNEYGVAVLKESIECIELYASSCHNYSSEKMLF